MEKNNCYIFWDKELIYTQCQECFNKNGKGYRWSKSMLYGPHTIKCDLCGTIIYKRNRKKKKKKGDNEATI